MTIFVQFDSIQKIVKDLLKDDLNNNYRMKWDLFKYKVRYIDKLKN